MQVLYLWHLVQVILMHSLDCCMARNGVMEKPQQLSGITACISLCWLWMVSNLVFSFICCLPLCILINVNKNGKGRGLHSFILRKLLWFEISLSLFFDFFFWWGVGGRKERLLSMNRLGGHNLCYCLSPADL